MEETTNTSPDLASKVKLPEASDCVPFEVPFTAMLTPEIGFPAASNTFPLTCCCTWFTSFTKDFPS